MNNVNYFYSTLIGDEYVCLSVCLFDRQHISETTCSTITVLVMYVSCSHGLVLWQLAIYYIILVL